MFTKYFECQRSIACPQTRLGASVISTEKKRHEYIHARTWLRSSAVAGTRRRMKVVRQKAFVRIHLPPRQNTKSHQVTGTSHCNVWQVPPLRTVRAAAMDACTVLSCCCGGQLAPQHSAIQWQNPHFQKFSKNNSQCPRYMKPVRCKQDNTKQHLSINFIKC